MMFKSRLCGGSVANVSR